ncbi:MULTISPECIES: HigA family addiction module antitoxin [Methylomonas]|uniref:HigA family addiction module antitoxin n=1 Tax=Methylomonas TaxID=416 RepID=UPI0007C9730F|nr:HigA family addiction module antitoxin [Methylomonas koyamae]
MKDNVAPMHPGKYLKDDILPKFDISINDAALKLGVARETLSRLLNCRASVSPEMAIRLGLWLFNVTGATAEDWLNMQARFDIQILKGKDFDIEGLDGDFVGFHSDYNEDMRMERKDAKVLRVIGNRLMKLRTDSAKMSRKEVANLLGVSSRFLRNLEKSMDPKISISFLISASEFYDVSIEHILGIKDELELRSPDVIDRSELQAIKEVANRVAAINNDAYRKVQSKIDNISKKFLGLSGEVRELAIVFDRFYKRNKTFKDLQGASSVLIALNRAVDSADAYKAILGRYKII